MRRGRSFGITVESPFALWVQVPQSDGERLGYSSDFGEANLRIVRPRTAEIAEIRRLGYSECLKPSSALGMSARGSDPLKCRFSPIGGNRLPAVRVSAICQSQFPPEFHARSSVQQVSVRVW